MMLLHTLTAWVLKFSDIPLLKLICSDAPMQLNDKSMHVQNKQ